MRLKDRYRIALLPWGALIDGEGTIVHSGDPRNEAFTVKLKDIVE